MCTLLGLPSPRAWLARGMPSLDRASPWPAGGPRLTCARPAAYTPRRSHHRLAHTPRLTRHAWHAERAWLVDRARPVLSRGPGLGEGLGWLRPSRLLLMGWRLFGWAMARGAQAPGLGHGARGLGLGGDCTQTRGCEGAVRLARRPVACVALCALRVRGHSATPAPFLQSNFHEVYTT